MHDMDVATFAIGKETTDEEVAAAMESFKMVLAEGKQVAFIIRKGALSFDGSVKYTNDNSMNREEVVGHIKNIAGDDIIVSTTGKISRELFEARTNAGEGHEKDFLTVGSMGHCSSIALGVAIQKPESKVWCIDGDGAALMHMGSMAVIGADCPENLVHIVINNGAHETVGGMPTVAGSADLVAVAKACGYKNAVSVSDFDVLDKELRVAKERRELSFIEARCAIGSRDDLGRPTTTALENKINFMKYLSGLK